MNNRPDSTTLLASLAACAFTSGNNLGVNPLGASMRMPGFRYERGAVLGEGIGPKKAFKDRTGSRIYVRDEKGTVRRIRG